MKRIPIVLTFVGTYLPGYKSGGPIQSVANMVAHLGGQFDFRIVTRDRDSGDNVPYSSVVTGQWQSVGEAEVRYVPAPAQSLSVVARLMRETPHDVIYLNSFFHSRSSILPLLARKLGLAPCKPVVLAPRGEFSKGALGLKSGKKRAFLMAARAMGLHRGVLWQASSEHEATDIRAVFGVGEPIHIASDLPRAVSQGLSHTARMPSQPLRLLFLSRISPMKNLTFIIDVLARVTVPVEMSIVGFIDDPVYWGKCQAQIDKLPSHIKVSYNGAVPSHAAPAVMAKSDLFFLPTLGENFGHAIIEALGAGTPAMISDKTPWRDFDEAGCGWVLPLEDAQAFASRIEHLFHEGVEDSARRRAAALAYARRFEAEGGMIDDNRRLLLRALETSPD